MSTVSARTRGIGHPGCWRNRGVERFAVASLSLGGRGSIGTAALALLFTVTLLGVACVGCRATTATSDKSARLPATFVVNGDRSNLRWLVSRGSAYTCSGFLGTSWTSVRMGNVDGIAGVLYVAETNDGFRVWHAMPFVLTQGASLRIDGRPAVQLQRDAPKMASAAATATLTPRNGVLVISDLDADTRRSAPEAVLSGVPDTGLLPGWSDGTSGSLPAPAPTWLDVSDKAHGGNATTLTGIAGAEYAGDVDDGFGARVDLCVPDVLDGACIYHCVALPFRRLEDIPPALEAASAARALVSGAVFLRDGVIEWSR